MFITIKKLFDAVRYLSNNINQNKNQRKKVIFFCMQIVKYNQQK